MLEKAILEFMHLKLPPASYIIYKALVESIFSHGKKKSLRVEGHSGSIPGRNSVSSVLEILLSCGLDSYGPDFPPRKVFQLPGGGTTSSSCAPHAFTLRALRETKKSIARYEGLFLLKSTGVTLAIGEGCCCPTDFLQQTSNGFSPHSIAKCWQAALFPSAKRDSTSSCCLPLPHRSLYRWPQINPKRFEVIIRLWSTSMKIYNPNL